MLAASEVTAEDLETLKGMIGKSFEPYTVEIERGMIKKLAEAVGDMNPLWQDEDKARKSRYGGIIAPPALYVSMMMNGFPLDTSVPLKRGLDAGHNWKFHAPIRPGDLINITSKVVDVYERQGKTLGKMVFFVFETTLTNQRGEKVCTHRGSILFY